MVLISYFNHTDALFNLNGTALYIVDDGKVTFEKGYPTTVPNRWYSAEDRKRLK